ncbi:MAG TPA: tetratricopeptide repeat protein [Acidobacteriota bacterium]|nr:tetratricopeptide repeat protein [Acidobacteriota bacterium]HNT17265.1 tetratricopeptide repeat protein [Acidobacteriota bacterium]
MMKIDTRKEDGKALREKYAIRGVPTVVLLDRAGNEIDRIVGYEKRDAWVKEILGYAFNVGTLADLKAQADEKKSGELFFKVAMKYYDRGAYADSSAYIGRAKSDQANSEELKGSIALLEGECLLQTEPDKGKKLLRDIMAGSDKEKADAAFEDLAGYYRKKKDHDGTVSIFKEMLLKKGDDKDFLNSYAWTLAEIGRELESAAEAARKAVELSKEDPQILDTLAEVYFKMGKKQLAVETIEKAIAKEPEDEYYKEQRAKFLE